MKTLYTAHATTIGGRNGRAATDDGKLSVELETPGAPPKKGVSTNPEQLFALGYSACFGSAVEAAAKKHKIDVKDVSVTAHISLIQEDTGGYRLAAELNVAIPGLDAATVQKLVNDAHQICPYSKATRGNIDVDLKLAA